MLDLFDKKDILKILKYIPSFFIVLGILKLIVFYKYFGIRIVEYLDFTEALISFTDSLIFYIFIFIFPMALFLCFFGKSIGEENSTNFKELIKLTFWGRIKHDLKGYVIPLIIFVITVVLLTVFNKWNIEILALFMLLPGTNIITFIAREIRITFINQYNYKIPATYFNTFIILLMISIFTIYFTIDEAATIKKKNVFLGTEIYLEKEVVKSDTITTYIGQTKNYVFMYNLKEEKSISIPRSRVMKLILKRK